VDTESREKAEGGDKQTMTPEWLNTRDLYIQYSYVEQLSWAAQKLLRKHGRLFDDEYSYWMVKSKKGTALGIVKRRPLWMDVKRMPAEKYHATITNSPNFREGEALNENR
jgi:hypothetical protein